MSLTRSLRLILIQTMMKPGGNMSGRRKPVSENLLKENETGFGDTGYLKDLTQQYEKT